MDISARDAHGETRSEEPVSDFSEMTFELPPRVLDEQQAGTASLPSAHCGILPRVLLMAYLSVASSELAAASEPTTATLTTSAFAVHNRRDARAAKEAVSDFHTTIKRKWRWNKTWPALNDLANFDLPLIADAALEELASERVKHYPAARRIIAGLTETDSLQRVISEGFGHELPRVQAQVILALGNSQPNNVDWITPTEAALDSESAVVRAAAIEVLGLAKASGRLERILELAEDDSPRVRQCVPDAVVRLAPSRAISILRLMSDDPSWRVRSAVVRALGGLGSRAASVELVDIFEREPGRVREDAHRELKALGHIDFGENAEAWRRFFLTIRGDSAVGETEPSPTRTTAPIAPPSHSTLFGLPALSRQFVVVIDVSDSMKKTVRPLDDDSPNAYRLTRLLLMQQELYTLLLDLDSGVALDLVSYSDHAESWKGRLVPMNSGYRANARHEIRDLRAGGMTNLLEALAISFDMAQDSLDDSDLETVSPDTLFVFTDGWPSSGTTHVLEYVAERNRELHLRIHCICLSAIGRSTGFMRDLAEMSDGDYANPLD